jgi:hypothetical protein
MLAAVWAGEAEVKRLLHNSLGNGGNHGIDIVQALVQHVKAPLDSFDVYRLFVFCRTEVIFLGQERTSREIAGLIIWFGGQYVKTLKTVLIS